MIKIGIIIGSTRPGRVGEKVGNWYMIVNKTNMLICTIDIKDYNRRFR